MRTSGCLVAGHLVEAPDVLPTASILLSRAYRTARLIFGRVSPDFLHKILVLLLLYQ